MLLSCRDSCSDISATASRRRCTLGPLATCTTRSLSRWRRLLPLTPVPLPSVPELSHPTRSADSDRRQLTRSQAARTWAKSHTAAKGRCGSIASSTSHKASCSPLVERASSTLWDASALCMMSRSLAAVASGLMSGVSAAHPAR